MKVTTTPKDCDKVDQIIPIMQEHLGLVMNLSRIKLLTFALHALCIVQTVSLHKIASAMPTSVERDSNLRRVRPGRNRKRTTQISLQAEIRCFQIFVMYLAYTQKHVHRAISEGWQCTAAQIPRRNGGDKLDWNDLHLRERLKEKDLKERI